VPLADTLVARIDSAFLHADVSARPFWIRHELALALVVVSALITLRSLVFAIYEHAYFDSDQAIVGLMAKHLSEGRAFPLYFYGQPFMLAVEAWWMAPFFWIGGPTVAMLRTSLIATNLIVGLLLVIGLVRSGRLRPWHAVVATLFFTSLPPFSAAHLVESQGGNIEPFLWVLLLWFARRRPIVFGAILAVGFLNREFTIYAVPVLVAADVVQRQLFQPERIRHWLLAGAAFLLVFELIQSLAPYADLKGPGTSGSAYGDTQVQNLTQRMSLQRGDLPGRVSAFARDVYGALVGAKYLDEAAIQQGRDWVFWPLAAAFLLTAGRVASLLRDRAGRLSALSRPFIWYVLGVGVVSAVMVVALRPINGMPFRYLLLTLLLPVGLTAALLALEPRRWVRGAVVAVAIGWASLSAVDHVRLYSRFAAGEPNPLRDLADALVARGVTVTEAPYWRAYKLTFLAQERVKIGALEFVRIDEYLRLAMGERDRLRRLSEQPCPGGEAIAGWYLCPVRP
jgi:hypothetical protein